MTETPILTVLRLIESRPSMYLGWDESQRASQLRALQATLVGNALALKQHRVGEEDRAALTELEEYLRSHSGADNLTGIDQIRVSTKTDEEAWNRVWKLIGEFRALKSPMK